LLHKPRIYCDSYLFKVVGIYSAFFFLSVLVNFEQSVTIPTYIVRLVGYFPLFLLVLASINSKRDINILLIVIAAIGTIVAIIGIGQFLYNDSLWGVQSTRKIIGSATGEAFFTESKNVGYQGLQGFRVASSTSNANSFSAVMCMTLIISAYVFKKYKDNKLVRLFLYGGVFLQLVGLVISGSRTGVFLMALIFLFKIYTMLRNGQVKRLLQVLTLAGIASIIVLKAIVPDDYLNKSMLNRYASIFEKGDSSFLSGGVRMDRAWIPHLKRIQAEMFFLGYGSPGIPAEEDKDQMSRTTHNDFLGILYFSGFWGLLAFMLILIRYFYIVGRVPDLDLRSTLRLVMIAYLIFGIGAESFIHKGQPFIFWAIVAIAARKSALFETREQVRRPFMTGQEKKL